MHGPLNVKLHLFVCFHSSVIKVYAQGSLTLSIKTVKLAQ